MYLFVTSAEEKRNQHVIMEIIQGRKIGVQVPTTPGASHGNCETSLLRFKNIDHLYFPFTRSLTYVLFFCFTSTSGSGG